MPDEVPGSTAGGTVSVTLLEEPAAPEVVDRLTDLVRAMDALVGLPGVVRVVGTDRDVLGRVRVLSEAAPGRTLQQIVHEAGSVDREVAVRLLRPVAEALAAAHAQGLVHGQVGPASIIVDDVGRARIAGIGLAAIVERVGTAVVAFSAPEVLRGMRPTEASDVYGLGLTLATVVAGSNPTLEPTDVNIFDVVGRIARSGPLEVDLGHTALTEAVRACTRPAPDERPRSADVATMLGRLADDPDASIRDLLPQSEPHGPEPGPPSEPGELPGLVYLSSQTMSAVGGGGGSMSTTTTTAPFDEAVAILAAVHGDPDLSDEGRASWSQEIEERGWRTVSSTTLQRIDDPAGDISTADMSPGARCIVHRSTSSLPISPQTPPVPPSPPEVPTRRRWLRRHP